MIGKIYNDDHARVINRIKKENYEQFDTHASLIYLYSFKCKFLLASTGSSLMIFNSNFELVNEIQGSKIFNVDPNDELKISSITSNQKDKFYFLNMLDDAIGMTDTEFNFIKVSKSGVTTCPLDICYSNNFVYVCDYGSSKIHQYNDELEHLKLVYLDFKPASISILDNALCVVPWGKMYLNFYDLNDFKLRKNYETKDGCGEVFVLNSNFYEFNYNENSISCYDKSGDFIKKANLKNKNFEKSISRNQILTTAFGDEILIHIRFSNTFILI